MRSTLLSGLSACGWVLLVTLSLLVPVREAFGQAPIKIAYVRNSDLWVMNADGSLQQQLTFNRGITSPTWRPDRYAIAYVTTKARQDLYLMTVSYDPGTGKANPGSELRITNDGKVLEAEFSPDGSKIAFSSSRDGDSDIYVINSDGTGLTQLTGSSDTAYDSSPIWSPDGTQLVFVSNRTGGLKLWIMNTDGTNPMLFLQNAGANVNPSWSPALTGGTSRVAFVNSGLWVVDVAWNGTTMSYVTMGSPRLITQGNFPTWSPDGAQIAFQANGDIYKVSLSTNAQTPLATSSQGEDRPAWNR